VREAFKQHLANQGLANVVLTLDGPVDRIVTPVGMSVIQIIIVQARGMKPTRFRLSWVNNGWRAVKLGAGKILMSLCLILLTHQSVAPLKMEPLVELRNSVQLEDRLKELDSQLEVSDVLVTNPEPQNTHD
jgi:hypothetical protein